MTNIFFDNKTRVSGGKSVIKFDNSFNLRKYIDSRILTTGTTYTFSNGLTEAANAVTLGGILTQENTTIDGVAGQTRNLYIGVIEAISGFGIGVTNDIDFECTNFSVTGSGAIVLGNSSSNSSINIVPTLTSPSGVEIVTANVTATTAINGQLLSLVRSSTGEVEYVNKKYSETFLSTDFVSEEITILASTHGMGSNLQISVYSGAVGSPKTALTPGVFQTLESIVVATNGDITLTSSIGTEFDGLIIIS